MDMDDEEVSVKLSLEGTPSVYLSRALLKMQLHLMNSPHNEFVYCKCQTFYLTHRHLVLHSTQIIS